MGWSHGVWRRHDPGSRTRGARDRLRAAVAYYPGCRQVHGWRTGTPVLMPRRGGRVDSGQSASTWPPVSGGTDVTQVTYPGRTTISTPLLRAEPALGFRGPGRGATTQHDPAGAEDSAGVRGFLATHLRPAGIRRLGDQFGNEAFGDCGTLFPVAKSPKCPIAVRLVNRCRDHGHPR
jgi:hypothetical protein